MNSLAYHIVDVFTDRAYAGNPLAVVLDADAVPPAGLAGMAREFNLSETAFVVRPTEPGAHYRVRIFTPETELPFAGHPSVGTAWLLRRLGRLPDGGPVVQQCGAGLLDVDLPADPAGAVRLTGAAPEVGPVLDAAGLLAAVGLAPTTPVLLPPRQAGTGISFTVLAVAPELVAAAEAQPGRIRALGGAGLALVGLPASPDAGPVLARVFAAGAGVAEDPATGSAVTALGAYLVTSGWLPAWGESAFTVRQGVEIGRPSTLAGSVFARDGAAIAARVAGHVVAVAEGRIVVPEGR